MVFDTTVRKYKMTRDEYEKIQKELEDNIKNGVILYRNDEPELDGPDYDPIRSHASLLKSICDNAIIIDE